LEDFVETKFPASVPLLMAVSAVLIFSIKSHFLQHSDSLSAAQKWLTQGQHRLDTLGNTTYALSNRPAMHGGKVWCLQLSCFVLTWLYSAPRVLFGAVLKVKVNGPYTTRLISLSRPWAHRWINHWSLWRMASVTPDLRRLPSKPRHHRPLTSTKLYCLVTAACACEQLAQCFVPDSAVAGSRTRDLLCHEPTS